MSKIKVENIVKTFNRHSRNANRVLKSVSFELPDKGLVCIFGKSGSGKTTLLNIIGGLDKQDSGKVYIDGECTTGKADKIRNEKIGFIFQNYYLERGYTIAEILRNAMIIAGFKDEEEIKRRSEEALKLVDMERFKNKRGDALSGGQQQRVAIARAIVKGGDIILADEPTGNLDAENTFKVMDILKEISKTHLVVVVTHEVTLIKKYADSHIKLIDGELVPEGEIDEAELASITYNNVQVAESDADLDVFTKSSAKRNGRLFNFKNIFKAIKSGNEEKLYSTANIFKQIFILAMAVVVCFFSFSAYEIIVNKAEERSTSESSVYTNLNTYSELRNLSSSDYDSVDFFEVEMRDGSFSYGDIAALSEIEETYIPKSIGGKTFENLYGNMPNDGEVLISRALAEKLKKDLRLAEINNDPSLLKLNFEEDFRVSGIVDGDESIVYLNQADYVNFLGVFDNITFVDRNSIFFSQDYVVNSFSAQICLDTEDNLADDRIVVEISRNALYKMMSDTTLADYAVKNANGELESKQTAISVADSTMYVQKFRITRDVMTTDIKIFVNEKVLDNVFIYLPSDLNAVNDESECYFEIGTSSDAQKESLTATLSGRRVGTVDIPSIYASRAAKASKEGFNSLAVYFAAVAILLLIYFFVEKSGSIKSSREYGVYRAIGANRSNLLFKETVTALFGNVVPYFVYFVVTTALIAVRYAIVNTPFGGFIGLSAAFFAASALIMTGISLIPYLFVLYKTPSQILASYDI